MTMLLGKEIGSIQSVMNSNFIWGEQTFFPNKYCNTCQSEQPIIKIRAFMTQKLKDIGFCSRCFSINSKPEQLKESTPKGLNTEVKIESGGTISNFTGDFLPWEIKDPSFRVYHCDTEMDSIGSIEKSADVREHYFECSVCLHEKLIKHFK